MSISPTAFVILLLFFLFPIWENLKRHVAVFRALEGIHAVIVGVIFAASLFLLKGILMPGFSAITLYNFFIILGTFLILRFTKLPSPVIVLLCLIYIISKKFLFHTILGRLLLVIGLITTTNSNKMAGLGLLVMICLAYSQMCNDFENMENPKPPSPTTTPTTKAPTKPESISKMPPTPDTATIEEKKRNIVTGKKASSLPIPSKDSSKDVSGTPSMKESFLGYSNYY